LIISSKTTKTSEISEIKSPSISKDVKNQSNRTYLQKRCKNENENLIKCLNEHKADMNDKNIPILIYIFLNRNKKI